MASSQRPATANWAMLDMLTWLEATDKAAVAAYGDTAVYVHPHPISWATAEMKKGWVDFQEDVKTRDNAAKLAKVGHHKAPVWVALCDTPNQSYVGITLTDEEKQQGVRQWDKVTWHTWGLAIVALKDQKGKALYFFDCDQELPTEGPSNFHIRDLTTQSQREFARNIIQDGGVNVVRAFIGNGGDGQSGQDLCLNRTTQWIEDLARKDGVAGTPGDVRFPGFVEIGLNFK